MKYLLFLFLLSSIHLQAQTNPDYKFYKTTMDYVNDTPIEAEFWVEIRDMSKSHIWIKKVKESRTGKRKAKVEASWALNYKGSNYFNLGYSEDLNEWKLFVKFDIEGSRFCTSFIDGNSPAAIKNAGRNNLGGAVGGVVGVAAGEVVKESAKWGKYWRNASDEKVNILFVSLAEIRPALNSRNAGSAGNLLKRKDVRKKLGIAKSNEEIKEMTFEEVIEIIKTQNN